MLVPPGSSRLPTVSCALWIGLVSGCGPGYSESESITSDDVSFSVCAKRDPDGKVRVASGSTRVLDGCQERGRGTSYGVWLSGGDRLVASIGEQRTELFRTRRPLIYEGELASVDPTQAVTLDVVMSRGDGSVPATIERGLPIPAVPALALSTDTVVATTATTIEAVWAPPTIDAPVAGVIDARPVRCVDAAGDALALETLPTLSLSIDATVGNGDLALVDELRRLPSAASDCLYDVVLTFSTFAIDDDPGSTANAYTYTVEPNAEARATSPSVTVRLIGPFREASS